MLANLAGEKMAEYLTLFTVDDSVIGRTTI